MTSNLEIVQCALDVRGILLILSMTVLFGCETAPLDGASPTSGEQIKDLPINLAGADFTPPQRSISDIKTRLEKPLNNEQDCDEIRADRKRTLTAIVGKRGVIAKEGSNQHYGTAFRYAVEDAIGSGNYVLAEQLLKARLASLEKEYFNKPVFYTQLARIRAAMGDVKGSRLAMRNASRAWADARKFGFERGRRPLYDDLGNGAILHAKGDLLAAENHYKSASENSLFAWSGVDPSVFYSAYARNLLEQGRIIEAEVRAREAFLAPGRPISTKRASSLSALASVMFEQGRINEAQYLSGKAVEMHLADCAFSDSVSLAKSRGIHARIVSAKRSWQEALDSFKAIESGLSNQPKTLQALFGSSFEWGVALTNTGQQIAAIDFLTRAIEFETRKSGKESVAVALLLGARAVAFFSNNEPDAATKDFDSSIPKLVNETRILSSDGSNTAGAIQKRLVLEGYLELLRSREPKPIFSTNSLVDEMFRISSAARGRRVSQALANSAVRYALVNASGELGELAQEEHFLAQSVRTKTTILQTLYSQPQQSVPQDDVEKLEGEIRELKSSLASLHQTISEKFPEYGSLLVSRPVSVNQVQNYLTDDEAFIFVFTAYDATYVWAITQQKGAVLYVADVDNAWIFDRVSKLRLALDPEANSLDEIPTFDLEIAYDVYQNLFLPLEEYWSEQQRLIISIEGPLASLPINVLPTRLENNYEDQVLFDGYRKVNWLSRNHTVVMVPSGDSFVRQRETLDSLINNNSFVGFADPIFDPSVVSSGTNKYSAASNQLRGAGNEMELRAAPEIRKRSGARISDLPRLPDTAEEVLKIADALGDSTISNIYLRADANEELVKIISESGTLEKTGVISFATHGLLPNDIDGLNQPALALSHPQVTNSDGDGLLTLDEILGLKLNTRLVVLSACNTAAGDGEGAEAASGLGRAFFYSGARAILVSNWPVHSYATRDLMINFFQLFATDVGNTPMANALTQAMNSLIDKGVYKDKNGIALFSYAHPLFWAPFSLVGEDRMGKSF